MFRTSVTARHYSRRAGALARQRPQSCTLTHMWLLRLLSISLVCAAVVACGSSEQDASTNGPRTAQPDASATGAPGAVEGFVFEDRNRNGVFDAGDVRLSDQTVLVTNPSASERMASVTTDSEGHFRFAELPGEEVRVSLQVPDGYERTNDDSFTVVVAPDRALPIAQFGVAKQD